MPKKILLADDSITIQKVISLTFANEDIDLTIVKDGDTAIAKAREIKPDLIMADIAMPSKNGYEVCEVVKNDPALKGIPVMLLAGTFEPLDEVESERVSADGCIVKPFESQELIDKVNELLSRPGEVPEAEPEKEVPGVVAEEADAATAQEIPPAPADIWEEGDFVSASGLEGGEEGTSAEAGDIWGGTFMEGGGREEKKEENLPQEEEFVELELGEDELIPLEEEVAGAETEEATEEERLPGESVPDVAATDTATQEEPLHEADEAVSVSAEEVEAEEEMPAASAGTPAPEGEGETEPVAAQPAIEEGPLGEVTESGAAEVETGAEAPRHSLGETTVELETAHEVSVEEFPAAGPEEELPSVEEKIEEKTKEAITEELKGEVSIPKERIEEIVAKVAKEVVEEVAWEVIPDMAEEFIKEEIRKVKEAISTLQ